MAWVKTVDRRLINLDNISQVFRRQLEQSFWCIATDNTGSDIAILVDNNYSKVDKVVEAITEVLATGKELLDLGDLFKNFKDTNRLQGVKAEQGNEE